METAWQDDAACRVVYDLDGRELDALARALIFYPNESNSRTRLESQARRICVNCTVKKECLDYAIEHNEVGIWGGVDESARRREANRRKREALK